jgi:hypothetical protein
VSFYYADRVIGVHHPNLARNKLLNIVLSAVPSSRHRFQGLMTMRQEPDVSTLSGLSLAKYVLERIVDYHESVEKKAEDFDNNDEFIFGVVDFLNDIGWIKQDSSGTYRITTKGKTNTITRHKLTVILGM